MGIDVMRMRNIFPASQFLLLWLISWCATAQENDIKFNHITVDDGLASNTVNGVIKDSRGFIWISTANGLSRYDGYTFENFRSNESDSLSISSNITYTIYEDHKKRIWMGSEKGLDLFNRDLARFDKHYFQGYSVRAIFNDSKGRLWIGSDDGVSLFNEKKGVFENYFSPDVFDVHASLYNTIMCITEDNENNLWIGTSCGGIFVYDFTKNKFNDYFHNPVNATSLSNNNIRAIIQDSHHKMWISTYGGGINLFHPETKAFTSYRENENGGLSNNLTNALWEDDHGKLWIGTDGNGLDIFDPDKEEFFQVVHSPLNSRSLNNNVVRTISNDGRGGIWVGTYAGGINFFNRNTEAFFHYRIPTFNGNTSTTAFAEDKDGNFWIGTDGGGLCHFNRANGNIRNFIHDKNNKNSLSDNRIISLMLDDKGYLWIGTYLGGLCRFNSSTNHFEIFTVGDRSKISDNIIWVVYQDSKQRIWAGTNNGLNLYDGKQNIFKSYNIKNSNLSNNMVRTIFEDSKHRLWIGTQDGLNLYNENENNFIITGNAGSDKNGISNNWIRTVNEDCNGNLLVGTFEGGVNIMDVATNKFVSYKEKDGLPDNMISGILADCNNNLWISTGKGLARLNDSTRTIKNYFVNDGLQDNQFNINASYKTRHGEFLFGGINGITLFVPEVITHIRHNEYAPPLVLTSFKIFNKEVLPDNHTSPLRTHISETTEIVLPYDQSVLTFEFSALNFIQPDKNQYSYRLVGFESDWNFVGNKRSGTYTNLEPGEYTFQVKASNNDGVWNEVPLSLKITITPPYWKTNWFNALLIVFSICVVLLLLRAVRKRIRAKIKINKVIAELKIKALIAQMNPHFIFNCLTSIQELIIINKQDEGMYYLEQFSKLLRIVLQSYEKNLITLKSEVALLDVYLKLERMRFSDQFDYNVYVDPSINTEDIIIPSFLIQPFVENAIWHRLMPKNGTRNVNVYFHSDKDVLVCSIEDDGIGREAASKINNKKQKTYQSMGLKIIHERVSLMKKQDDLFDLKIIDEVDSDGRPTGTSVILKIPLWRTRDELHIKEMQEEHELTLNEK
jgi:ligand-binding sensor domain-containing protein